MKTPTIILLLLLAVLFAPSVTAAKSPDSYGKNSLLNKAAIQEWKFFDINTIQATVNSAGPYCDYLRTNSSGLFWPKGTPKTAVYTAGMWVIGKHRPTGLLRTAVQDYQTEFQPGPILSTYNTTLNNVAPLGDPADPTYKIYKVHRKDSVGGNADYDNWPGQLGAPYVDVNNNNTWDKGVDKPFLWGDQVLWCVYNDGNPAPHNTVGKTNPMGIEVQTTYFGFDQPGALGNIMFMRWKIINKSDADYDSVFISMWSDTDLGDANDDMAAVDTLRKIAYVYNSDNDDGGASGYGSKPPADGFVFFQGPRVSGAAADTALFEGKKRAGERNLPGTSHVVYFNGGGGIGWNDPPLGNVAFAEQAYNLQNGLVGTTGAPFVNPDNNLPSKFVFPGDPVTGSGWTHIKTATTQDVRSMISSGPFTLAKGDTQEIVGGFVIAQGADRLQSVSILRLFTAVAQEAFDVNFQLASPPPQPRITVGEYSNEIMLNWGDPAAYGATEAYNFAGAGKDYKFEGYNIYQLAGPSPANFESRLVATYDVVNGVKTVVDNVIDQESGLTLPKPIVFGNDYGVKRHFLIDKDYIKGGKLINGKEYYFAVTSYAYNHDPLGVTSGIPQILENSKSVLTIIPRGIPAGSELKTEINQFLYTNRNINGDDAVMPQVIDPKSTTNSSYQVIFAGVDTNVTSWSLVRTGLGAGGSVDTVVKASTNFEGDDMSPLVDGVMFRVTKPKAGPRRDSQTPQGFKFVVPGNTASWVTGRLSTGADALGIGNFDSTLSRSIVYPQQGNFVTRKSMVAPKDLKKVEIVFSNTATQKAYRYLFFGAFGSQIRDSSFLPFVRHRLTNGGFNYQDYVNVPFTAWEVDSLDGAPTRRQLNVGFLEFNDSIFDKNGLYIGRGAINGQWMPTHGANGGTELMFIFASDYNADTLARYTRNPAQPANNTQFLNLRTQLDSTDMYYAVWLKKRDTLSTFKEGEKLVITPNYPLVATRSYGLTVPQNVKNDPALIKEQISKINVFPNPYFANNRAETNIYQRFVTFTNLPQKATIRVINLAGERVKTINHDNTSGFERWDLRNESGLPVASGMYIAFIEIPDAGTTTLKLAVIQPEERPAR